jgi:hypothetical protein
MERGEHCPQAFAAHFGHTAMARDHSTGLAQRPSAHWGLWYVVYPNNPTDATGPNGRIRMAHYTF